MCHMKTSIHNRLVILFGCVLKISIEMAFVHVLDSKASIVECRCICIPNNVRWQQTPKLNRHQRGLFHLRNVVYSLDAQSTNTPHLDCAPVDQRQRRAYRLRKTSINMPNTANEKTNSINERKQSNWECTLKITLILYYHVAVLMTQKNGIAIE